MLSLGEEYVELITEQKRCTSWEKGQNNERERDGKRGKTPTAEKSVGNKFKLT